MENYSNAYEKFVDNEEDLAGMLAYAIYKKQKREFIVRNSLPHDSDRVKKYHCDLNSSRVELLKSAANDILNKYAEKIVELTVDDLRKDITEGTMLDEVKSQYELYSDLLAQFNDIVSKSSKEVESLKEKVIDATSFWKSIVSGIVSSVLFSIILSIMTIIIWSNPFNVFKDPPKELTNGLFSTQKGQQDPSCKAQPSP